MSALLSVFVLSCVGNGLETICKIFRIHKFIYYQHTSKLVYLADVCAIEVEDTS
jgi:hypothetical protein